MTLNQPKTKALEEKLTELKRQEEENQAKRLAESLGLPYVNLMITPIDFDDLIILPQEKAKQGNLVVIKKTGRVLHLAVKDPSHPSTRQIIQELQEQGFECRLFIASLTSLKKGWTHYESAPLKTTPIRGVFIIQKKELEEYKKSLQTIQELKKTIGTLSTTRLLTIIMAGAIEMNASDIHLEPEKGGIRLRYRIDGLLQEITNLPNDVYRFLLSRIKTLSDMLLNIHDVSQDGRFTVKILDGEKTVKVIDIRTSVLPSGYGESIVMRLLGLAVAKLNLNELGIRPELFKIIKNQISQPNGMILNTGPTGSGKTTTLYACLNYINKPGRKIITVEDPIEYKLTGITQTQISQRKGHTFANALRSVVRQDPDILMVGEIRDTESAAIAIQFALTGHLVFSTLHTNDAAGAIPRLVELKIKPSLIPSAINLVIAQRLVRRLCPACKKPYQPSSELIKAIKKVLSTISPKAGLVVPKKISVFYQATGCPQCHGLGYQGRIGIFELFTVNEIIEKLILQGTTSYELKSKAIEEGMVTLMQDALLRAIEGITSLEEVERIVGPLISTNL
jgi:type II secretory ATPase GspE/PulE/Tfp pilus assembly ATPase PilB-like protein